MKRTVFLLALCFSLIVFTGCSQNNPKPPECSQASAAAPTAEVEHQTVEQILHEQIRLYEYGCYGTEYTEGKETFYLPGFAGMHLQTNKIEYEKDSDRQRMLKLATEGFFNVAFDEDYYFGNTGFEDKRLSIQPTETIIKDDMTTVVVQRFLNGQELLDSKYTFRKAAMPQSLEGTIFEQLAYDHHIWQIETVETVKDPISAEVVTISNAEELIQFSNDVSARRPEAVNGKFVLTADIDLTGNSDFMPVGTYYQEEEFDTAALNLRAPMGFNGTFDGGGHTISGFSLSEYTKVLGFFRVLNDDAIVKNLNLQGRVVNSYIEDQGCYTGGFAGKISSNALVEHCSFAGDVEGESYVGGFVGKVDYIRNNEKLDEEGFWTSGDGLIQNCTSNVTVTAAYYAGGFAGSVLGNIENCTANGDVIISKGHIGLPKVIGGFCGEVWTQLSNCHSNVKVTHFVEGANRMGNFVGGLGRKDIINCTIKAEVVNPDWFMVGMKDYLKADVDIQIVD